MELRGMHEDKLINIGMVLAPVFAQNAVVRALVFGSYARGEETQDSDIDFLVEFADGASILDLSGLIEDINDTINLPADVLTVHCLMKEPKEFAENVIRDARVVYEIS